MTRDEYIKLLLDKPCWPDISARQLFDLYYNYTIKPFRLSDLDNQPFYSSILIYGLRCPLAKSLFFVGVSYDPKKDFKEFEQTFGYSSPVLAAWLTFLQERWLKPIPVIVAWTNSAIAKDTFDFRVKLAICEENPYLLNQFIGNQGFFFQPEPEAQADSKPTDKKKKARF